MNEAEMLRELVRALNGHLALTASAFEKQGDARSMRLADLTREVLMRSRRVLSRTVAA